MSSIAPPPSSSLCGDHASPARRRRNRSSQGPAHPGTCFSNCLECLLIAPVQAHQLMTHFKYMNTAASAGALCALSIIFCFHHDICKKLQAPQEGALQHAALPRSSWLHQAEEFAPMTGCVSIFFPLLHRAHPRVSPHTPRPAARLTPRGAQSLSSRSRSRTTGSPLPGPGAAAGLSARPLALQERLGLSGTVPLLQPPRHRACLTPNGLNGA